MNSEQLLLSKWKNLSLEQQKKVIDFVELLAFDDEETKKTQTQSSALGERLQKIRDKIVASGVPLLSAEEIEREKAERRGGYQGDIE